MIQRYNEYSHNLAYCAVEKCFKGKWRRNDVLTFIEEWAGIPRWDVWQGELENSFAIKYEVMDSLAYMLDDVMEDILHGRFPDIDEVKIRERPDGMTGKIRKIAYLCILHQLLGHIAKLGLDPLLHARIFPTQHASIPKHGQTKLVTQVRRYLRKGKLRIQYYQKTDCTNAYASLQYSVVIEFIKKEIPDAKWLIALLEFLAMLAPDGHLIIGGYLDAWLFNFAMSYAIREAYKQGRYRRGVFHPFVQRIVTFMDDFSLLGQTITGLERIVAWMKKWMWEHLRMTVRTTTGIIRWLSETEENAHRSRDRPAQRGCPNLDMGGYRIYRTHYTMRRRVVKRVIRCFERAWAEIQRTGTLKRARAASIIARNGPVDFTYSEKFKNTYHVRAVFRMAKRVSAYWNRVKERKRKEKLAYVLRKCAEWRETFSSVAGAFA